MANSRYQYGTSPRKLEPDYNRRTKKKKSKQLKVVETKQKNQVKTSSNQKKSQLKAVALIVSIFLVLLAISFRNSQIDNKFTQIQQQKNELATLQKENEQLKVSIENSMNLSNIEKVAKEELGMQKLSNQQTVYVTLPKKDYVESASEKIEIEQEKNWFKKIIEKLFEF